MLYATFTIGSRDYKLALNTRSMMDLEKKIGCNPLSIFGDEGTTVPTITTMVQILTASLQKYEHGYSEADAMELFDKWLEEGHSLTDFIQVILDIYKASGLVRTDDVERKN